MGECLPRLFTQKHGTFPLAMPVTKSNTEFPSITIWAFHMRKIYSIAAVLSVLLSQQAYAFGVSPAIVYSNLNWNVSSAVSGLTACNNMRLDGSGNLSASASLLVYGAINCPAIGIGYSATGSGFIDVNGMFNMSLTFGPGIQLICARLSQVTLSGVCSVINSTGAQIGTAAIGYVP